MSGVGLFSRKRYVVTNLHLALEGASVQGVHQIVREAARRIVQSEGDFDAASSSAVEVVEALLGAEQDWAHVASWGEVFRREEDAAAYGDESFADAAGRYLSSGGVEGGAPRGSLQGGTLVVMLTAGYEGEAPELEKTLATRADIAAALTAIKGLHHRGQLQLVHLHHAPGTPGEVLTEEQLAVSYPELLAI